MTVQDRIATYLIRASGQSYCAPCLSSMLDLPLEQVERRGQAGVTIALANGPDQVCRNPVLDSHGSLHPSGGA